MKVAITIMLVVWIVSFSVVVFKSTLKNRRSNQ